MLVTENLKGNALQEIKDNNITAHSRFKMQEDKMKKMQVKLFFLRFSLCILQYRVTLNSEQSNNNNLLRNTLSKN